MNKCCFFFLILASFGSAAHDTRIDKITVYGQRQGLLGQSISASQGQISAQDIARKPIARTGEILEFVPGMVVTQHSGSGKANQYFLRGFNLDHGTDFSTNVDGMPVNMRTHGHGQGYSDLNFIIPELVHSIDYFKGPYYAAIGDFSSAGAAQFSLMKRLNTNMLSIEYGQDNYQRLVAAHGTKVGTGDLVAALELQSYDGPWLDSDQDAKKRNAMLRYSNDTSEREFSITLMAYDNEWAGADQIPQRAVTNGDLDRLASVDKTLGGESSRYSLSANWLTDDWASSAYVIKSELDLFSNFTYFLEDPINGDQFEQVDNRVIAGANFQYIGNTFALNTPWYYRVGSELRFDNISEVALYKTAQRKRLRSVRNDHVKQWS
ncbi:MAG: TonB-dependent receptor plug domain-containing protein, partial [Psychrobium sp.]|nr:TonB-dependent receptor plug domain-containing protein [Psychrobium sp.]